MNILEIVRLKTFKYPTEKARRCVRNLTTHSVLVLTITAFQNPVAQAGCKNSHADYCVSSADGFDVYDGDFTHFELLGDTVTSDMKYHVRRKESVQLAEPAVREITRRSHTQLRDMISEHTSAMQGMNMSGYQSRGHWLIDRIVE